MDSRLQRIAAVGLLVASLACGTGYRPVVSAGEVADSQRPGKLLVAYLSQTSADPVVCDVNRSDGPAVTVVNASVARTLGDAFAAGVITPERWADCSLRLWSGAGLELQEALGDELVDRLGDAIEGELSSPPARARLAAVTEVFERRPAGSPVPADRVRDVLEQASKRAGSESDEARALLDEVVASLAIEGGSSGGLPVDHARISATTDEDALAVWASRHPEPALRDASGARLLDLRLQRLPEAWREEARASVVKHGFFGLPERVVVLAAAWEPGPDDTVLLRLLQNPKQATVRLLPSARDASRSPDTSVDLHGALKVRVDGLAEPITLCPGADRWDPTPCIPPERARLTHPVATLTPTGRIVFPETLALDDFVRLGGDGDRLAAQVLVGGVIAPIDLPIVFDSVPGFTYRIPEVPEPIRLVVEVWELSHERLLIEYKIALERGPRRMLVPESDAQFKISAVFDDADARVGADFLVRVRCTHCADVDAALRRMITSQGGKVAIQHVED